MRFTTMTAKYPGTCKRCRKPISPGETIRYGGKGLTYHLAAECSQSQPEPPNEPVRMTPDLAESIRQTFTDLLAQPVNLLDPLAETDAQYYNAARNTAPITPSAIRQTIDADLF